MPISEVEGFSTLETDQSKRAPQESGRTEQRRLRC